MVRELTGAGLCDKIYGFLTKPAYFFVLMLLTAASFALNAEVVLYTVFALIAAFTAFCAPDVLPLMPLLAFGYVATSTENNPGRNAESVFSGATGVYVIILAVVIVSCLVYRLIRDRKRMFRKNGDLLWGLVILTGAYVLSGIGYPGYWGWAWKNVPYALVQGLALLLPYWLLTGGVDWEKHRKDLFAWMGLFMGCLLVFEVLWIYHSQDVLVNGVIARRRIYTGWGMYNNLGNMLAMMIPFAFWLGGSYKKQWAGYLMGLVFLAGVFLTCSRSSMIFGVLCYGACCLVIPYEKHRMVKWGVVIGLVAAACIVLAVFYEQLLVLYMQILDDVHELTSRFTIYKDGLNEFLKNPLFGGSFYPAEGLSYSWAKTDITSFMPARWHNTVIQLLASTGIVGILAYGFHRYQTVRLVMGRRSPLQMLMVIAVLVMLLGSLTDCHMFNVGPGMFYAMLLAWLEKKEM